MHMHTRIFVVAILLCVSARALASTSGSALPLFDGFFHVEEAVFTSDSAVVKLGKVENLLDLHTVTFAIKPKYADALADIVGQVSDPSHDEYGNYPTYEEYVGSYTSVDTATAVQGILAGVSGIDVLSVSKHGDFISVQAPIAVLETFFQTEFFMYEDTYNTDTEPSESETAKTERKLEEDAAPVTAVRAETYYLPTVLEEYVGAVFGVVDHPFAMSHKRHRKVAHLADLSPEALAGMSSGNAAVIGYMYPQLIETTYGIDNTDAKTLATQGIFATIDQTYSISDLHQFQKVFGLKEATPVRDVGGHELKSGCANPGNCFEANLDVEYIMSTAQNAPTTFWYEADTSSSAFTLFLQELAEDESPPMIVSISYGMPEHFVSSQDKYYFDVQAQKLALRGVTVVAAAGDNGVSDAKIRLMCGYNPLFPASSAYVLAVGATQGPEMGLDESVCSNDNGCGITTGGGFSNQYETPAWQRRYVEEYLAGANADPDTQPYESHSVLRPRGLYPYPLYNRNGRGYPDISALGSRYIIVVNATYVAVSGTSCSAPVVAGMISLVNAARMKKGYPSLGFLNPALYASNGSVAHDIAEDGGNNKCFALGGCCREGFHSADGWDPVTGFGSIKFPSFYKYFVGLVGSSANAKNLLQDSDADLNAHTHSSSSNDGSFTMRDFMYALFNTSTGLVMLCLSGVLLVVGGIIYARGAFGGDYPGGGSFLELSSFFPGETEERTRGAMSDDGAGVCIDGGLEDRALGSVVSSPQAVGSIFGGTGRGVRRADVREYGSMSSLNAPYRPIVDMEATTINI